MDQPQAIQPPAPQADIFPLVKNIVIKPGKAFAALKLSPAPPAWKLLALMLAAFALYYLHMLSPFIQSRSPLAPFVTITFGDINPAAIPSLLGLLALSAALAPLALHIAARLLGGRGALKAAMAGFYLITLAALTADMALNLVFFAANLFGHALLGCAAWFVIISVLSLKELYGLGPAASAAAWLFAFFPLFLAQSFCVGAAAIPCVKLARELSIKTKNIPVPLAIQYGDGEANAAGMYGYAAKLLSARLSALEKGRALAVVYGGFSDPDGSLAAVLGREREALDAFRQAAAAPCCNFAALTLKEKTLGADLPFPDVTTLPLLTLAEARAFESRGRTDLALDRLLAVVSAADHLGQQTNFMLAAAVFRKTILDRLYQPAASLLAYRGLNAEDSRLLLKRLDAALISARPLDEALREQESFRSAGGAPVLKELAALFREPAAGRIVREYLALEKDMENALSTAAAHNDPGKYTEFMTGLASRTADIHRFYGKKITYAPCVLHPARLAACYLPVYMADFPDLTAIIAPHYLGETKLKLLTAAAAIRVYEFTAGRPPARLNDLVPEYLADLPRDDFGGGPLKYVRKPDGSWLLYSAGPDRKDDNGAMDCRDQEWTGTTALPGDLVFRSPVPGTKAPAPLKVRMLSVGGPVTGDR